jgi:hypothetical protein
MMRALSWFLSVIFHPLLMATYSCLLIFFIIPDTIYDYLTSFAIKWRITLIVFLFSFAFPVINIFLLYKLKRLPSFTLKEQKERTFPYLLTSLFYFGLFYLLYDVNIWPSLKLFVAGGGLCILLVALINMKYKISAHMVGFGGVLGSLISISYLIRQDLTPYYIAVIVLAGLTAAARLFLGSHRPSQIYAGFMLGVLVQCGLFIGLQKIIFA